MDGPYFRCDYLGFTAIAKPPTSLNALQPYLKDLYLKYRRQSKGANDASLKLVQNGIFITLFSEGKVADELFFSFDAVNFIEAVRFAIVRNASEKKPKAIFVPLDEGKGPISDKHSFALDKTLQFLVSATHPPLVACVVRRPRGVKALDLHLFALETAENALHVSSLVGSAQTPPGFESRAFDSRMGGFESRGNSIEVESSFNRGFRGDAVRPEQTEYSFYRGQQHHYEKVQNVVPYPNEIGRLPPTNIHRPAPGGGYYPPGPGGMEEAMVYGLYEQPRSGALIAGPMPRGAPLTNNRTASTGGEQQHQAMLHRDDLGRGGNVSGNRNSAGLYQESPQFPGSRNSGEIRHYPQVPSQQPPSRTSTPNTSRPSQSPRQDNPDFGPVFSASNIENRDLVKSHEELNPEQFSGGKPIAKVPPHLRGIKVLPTDFRNVKLKPRAVKRSDSLDSSNESSYDNNNDIMKKYKSMQEKAPDDPDDGYRIATNGSGKMDNNLRNYEQDPSENHLRPDHRQKQESARHPNRFSAPVYAESTPWSANNRGQQPSQSAYSMGVGEDQVSAKDAEIAYMFSNMNVDSGNHRRQRTGFEMEQGLGYLP